MGMTTQKPWIELKVFMDRDGINQRELANATGLSATYIGDLYRGRRRPNGRVRKLIANALRVPQSMLIPATDNHDSENAA